MSNEREQSRTVAESDERVSSIYREVADERTPERLNRRILASAARATESRYARSIHWTRPLAWAATIVLCLAITLQVTRVPTPEGLPVPMPAEPLRQEPGETSGADTREQSSLERKVSNSAADAPAKIELDRAKVVPATTDDNAPVARKRAVADLQEEIVTEEGLKPEVAEFELRDTDMLRRADEMAQVQIGESSEAAPASAPALAARSTAIAKDVDHCDDAARETPESWLSCIERLEEAGLIEAAKQQREQLSEAFPDFEIP